MAEEPLPDEVRQLLNRHLSSMDHVTVLLAMRSAPKAVHQASAMMPLVHVSEPVATVVLADLAESSLVVREGDGYRYAPNREHAEAVDRLADMYNTRPVTLVRAIYDRPVSAAKTFADAFRIRKAGE